MSSEGGVPLLNNFEDDPDDPDDLDDIVPDVRLVSPPKRCGRRQVVFAIVLALAGVLLLGLVVSISLGVTLKSSSSHPSGEGNVPRKSPRLHGLCGGWANGWWGG